MSRQRTLEATERVFADDIYFVHRREKITLICFFHMNKIAHVKNKTVLYVELIILSKKLFICCKLCYNDF